jgi:hypothetical protein
MTDNNSVDQAYLDSLTEGPYKYDSKLESKLDEYVVQHKNILSKEQIDQILSSNNVGKEAYSALWPEHGTEKNFRPFRIQDSKNLGNFNDKNLALYANYRMSGLEEENQNKVILRANPDINKHPETLESLLRSSRLTKAGRNLLYNSKLNDDTFEKIFNNDPHKAAFELTNNKKLESNQISRLVDAMPSDHSALKLQYVSKPNADEKTKDAIFKDPTCYLTYAKHHGTKDNIEEHERLVNKYFDSFAKNNPKYVHSLVADSGVPLNDENKKKVLLGLNLDLVKDFEALKLIAKNSKTTPEIQRTILDKVKNFNHINDEDKKGGTKEIHNVLVHNPNLDPKIADEIISDPNYVSNGENTSADIDIPFAGLKQEHFDKMLDLASKNHYQNHDSASMDNAMDIVANHSNNPDTIRKAFEMAKDGDEFERNKYLFEKNPSTPVDVLEKLDTKGARSRLADSYPDKLYEEDSEYGGPPDSIRMPGDLEHKQHFGSVDTKQGLSKMRAFRDRILEKDPTNGQISPKELGQGPFEGGWKPVQEKNGNISAKKIQELIDKTPSAKYNFSHQLWGGDAMQTHSNHNQKVFKLNVTDDHVNQMKQAGVYGTYSELTRYSNESRHPVDKNHGIGWIRYEHHQPKADLPGKELKGKKKHSTIIGTPEAIHVDEIQTDMGPNTIAQLKQDPEQAKSRGVDVDHLDKIQSILFGNHHPSEVLMEAFKQHKRDLGLHDVPIHMLHAKTKAPISGMKPDEALPAHMKFTYEQMPKKMGFVPAKYGDTKEQDTPELQGAPTWKDTIRKFEEALLVKSVDDLFPSNTPGTGVGFKDYSHLLNEGLKEKGYTLELNNTPNLGINSVVMLNGKPIGVIKSFYNIFDPKFLSIESIKLNDVPEAFELKQAMYESVLAEAKHIAQVSNIHFSDDDVLNTHLGIAQKHGLAYASLPEYSEGQSMSNQSYGFLLKSAAFRDTNTGEIFGTGSVHDVENLPSKYESNIDSLEEGFLTDDGGFLTRQQAQAISKIKEEILFKNEDGLIAMLETDNPLERIMALKSKQVQPHHLYIAINDHDPVVRAFVAQHKIVNSPILMELLRQCKDPDTFNELLAHPECQDEHIKYALETNFNGNGGEIEPDENAS